jgi:O-acetyl-ADP-ribose deacetylase (regulator of RNase III)
MPVTHITGNALDFPEETNVLVHVCNRQGTMGAGIARQIAEEYPAAAEADQEAFKNGGNQLGMFSSAVVAGGTKRVCNLYAQTSYGTETRQLDYEALYTGLERFRAVLEDAGKQGRVYRVAMPWLGTGLAGGSRKVVGAMIEDIFGESSIEVFVVDYQPKAREETAAPETPVDSSQTS